MLVTEEDFMNKGTKIAIGVVALVAIIGVGYLALANSSSADVRIEVYSNHLVYDVEVFVYVDGKQIWYEPTVSPGQYLSLDYKAKFRGDSTTIVIKAVGQGGGLGTNIDSTTLIVQNGQSYLVKLYV